MPSTVDGQVGNWKNMVGPAAVAARAARQAPKTVEDLRAVTLMDTPNCRVLSVFDVPSDRYKIVYDFGNGDPLVYGGYTLRDLIHAFTPSVETLKRLQTMRAQMIAPVSFVCEPEPATAAD